MATRTYARLYDSYQEAVSVVQALESAGIPHSDISIVGQNQGGSTSTGPTSTSTGSDTGDHASTGAGTGATLGTVLGGGAGLLAGLGALAIPGIGPVVAAGWLIATLSGAGVGAAAGGLLGSLTGAGVSHDEAQVYDEGVRRGGTLVSVRADESRSSEVLGTFDRVPSRDWQTRGAEYRSSGWNPGANPTNDIAGSTTPLPGDDVVPGRNPGGSVL